MNTSDGGLREWMKKRRGGLGAGTLEQLLVLLELTESESVADLSRHTGPKGGRVKESKLVSQGVNYRQKLSRLEEALQVGRLVQRQGKTTRPTEAGLRVAGELRLFLQELVALSSKKSELPRWKVGAGDAWLQGAVVPALAQMASTHPQWTWEVVNLRAFEVCREVRDGNLHFGLVRKQDLTEARGLEEGATIELKRGLRIVAGAAGQAPKTAKELVQWLVENRRPLVQQGSAWPHYRTELARKLGLGTLLAEVDPAVICESHPQAYAAAQGGQSWCVVPSCLGAKAGGAIANAELEVREEMVIILNPRMLGKHVDGEKAKEALRDGVKNMVR